MFIAGSGRAHTDMMSAQVFFVHDDLTSNSLIFFCYHSSCISAEPSPEHGGQTCSNGIPGVEGTSRRGSVACCPTTCLNADGEPECGGPGCRKRQGGKTTCCINKINRSGEDCADSNNAPCFIGKRLTQSNGWTPLCVSGSDLVRDPAQKTARMVGTWFAMITLRVKPRKTFTKQVDLIFSAKKDKTMVSLISLIILLVFRVVE